jgi:hypothetical protein
MIRVINNKLFQGPGQLLLQGSLYLVLVIQLLPREPLQPGHAIDGLRAQADGVALLSPPQPRPVLAHVQSNPAGLLHVAIVAQDANQC